MRFRAVVASLFSLLMAAGTAAAQQLAVRWYGTADGLVSSNITSLEQDSRGYLWIATLDGLSRFDGTSFVNYHAPEDLSEPVVWTVAEDPWGRMWIGTNGQGVARLNSPVPAGTAPSGRPFDVYRITPGESGNAVDAIAFDGRGRMWCVSDRGLYRADANREPLAFQRLVAADGTSDHDDVFVQAPDHLWFAMGRHLIEARGDRIVEHPLPAAYSRQSVAYLRGRADGTIVAALQSDVLELTTSGGHDAWRAHGLALAHEVIESLAIAPDGSLWIGTSRALIQDGARRQRFDRSSGINEEVTALFPDRGGRLWIGTRLGGVGRLSTHAVRAFTTAQGLPSPIASRVVEGSDGTTVVSTWRGPVVIRDDRVERVPLGDTPPFDGISRRLVADRFGHWWIGTSDGLFFIRGPAFDLRRAVHVGASYGLPPHRVFDGPGLRVIDDTLFVVLGETLYKAHVTAGGPSRFETVTRMRNRAPLDVIADASGRLWMATFHGLAWQPPQPRTPVIEPQDGGLDPRAFLRDSRGALWLGMRSRGLAVTTDPAAARPTYRVLTTRDGLSSDTVWSIAEAGRLIYVGTGRGLDRFDRDSGAIDNLFAIDGLAPSEVYDVVVDSRRRVWAATSGGVVRFDPPLNVVRIDPPAVYVVGMRLNGQPLGVAPLGAREVSVPAMIAPRSDLSIEYAGVDVDRTVPATFEYRLAGIDASWSAPTPQRVVSYPRLPPGRYAFEVRSATRNSRGPAAVVMLDVRPALWQRWWFLALSLGGLVAAALAVQRVRLGRVIALERVRRQIASDLHDDLGSGLAQIAVLAEVARRDRGAAREGIMADVAEIARGLRASVGDIVWAVDPRHDHLADAVSRMRELAVSMLEPQGVSIAFDAEIQEEAYLAPDRRRHLLLLFKEAVTNIARHASARNVTIDVRTRSGRLVLAIADDGRGFDVATATRGNGLDNLRSRARGLGGGIRIDSAPGRGTRIEAECPL